MTKTEIMLLNISDINILMPGITYKGIAFPLIFSLLTKRGNSNWEERKEIMERFIRLFGADCIDCLVGQSDKKLRRCP